jgi:vacuolar-type H+-ATPase subunit I/STV1
MTFEAIPERRMTPLTAFFAKFIGAYSLFAAAWLLLRREAALGLIERISNDPVSESVIGVLRLVFGLAVVSAHNVWGDWLQALVSALGWIALFSGLATMFLPTGFLRRTIERMRFKEQLPIYALLSALLGTILLFGGFAA